MSIYCKNIVNFIKFYIIYIFLYKLILDIIVAKIANRIAKNNLTP